MRRNQTALEPDHKQASDADGAAGEDRREASGLPYNYEDEDGHQRVGFRPNPLPAREEEEEELAEADIMEVLDDDDLDKMQGPDA